MLKMVFCLIFYALQFSLKLRRSANCCKIKTETAERASTLCLVSSLLRNQNCKSHVANISSSVNSFIMTVLVLISLPHTHYDQISDLKVKMLTEASVQTPRHCRLQLQTRLLTFHPRQFSPQYLFSFLIPTRINTFCWLSSRLVWISITKSLVFNPHIKIRFAHFVLCIF